MARRATAVLAAAAAAAVLAVPADGLAKSKQPPRPVTRTHYLNWAGECSGAGFLSLTNTPNSSSCALFFPQTGTGHVFSGAEGLPLALDASQPVTVDFSIFSIGTVVTDFHAVLRATIAGDQVELASGTVNVAAAALGRTAIHFDLDPAADFDREKLTALSLEITWSGGVTYSEMDLDTGTAKLVVHGFK